MNKILIIGNWKMNLNIHQASLYVHQLTEKLTEHKHVEMVLAPPVLALQTLSLQAKRKQFKLCAQNIYFKDHGAYTGEISATMLRGLVQYVLVGHSERRHIFGETDKDIRAKVQAALRNELTPVLCVGETADERTNNETKHVLHDQITGGLANVASEEIKNVVIAYEPVWAISSGDDFANHQAPTPGDLEKVRDIIRKQVAGLYGEAAADHMRILYGGSVTKDNAKAFLSLEGIDGFIVGGASLKLEEFSAIVKIAQEIRGEK